MSKKTILLLSIGVFLGAGLAGIFLPRLFSYSFHGMIIQAPEPAPEISLTDHSGLPTTLNRFQGKLIILYFGYTSCPDVCPASMGVLGQALEGLGEKAEEVQVLFITVDPARDTPARLADYVTHFHPTFLGVTGSPEEIAQAAALYGIYYEAQPTEEEDVYWMDHTASTMVIDQEGRLKLVWPFGVSVEDVEEDLRRLLK